MKSSSPGNRKQYAPSQRQSLTVKTQNLNHFDSRWAQLKISLKNIPTRSNHTSIIHNQYMYIHGGYDIDKGILSDFHRIDLTEQDRQGDYCWMELNNMCEGSPIRLKNHTAVTFEDRIVVFGGEGGGGGRAAYVYDILGDVWIKAKTLVDMPGVDSHCVAVVEGVMYVYGGYVQAKAELMNDVWALDLKKLTWQKVYNSTGMSNQPEGRSNSAMVGYQKDLFVFGGSNGVYTLNDFWKFSLTTKKWEIIQTQNAPSPRRGHSMLIFSIYIFMFGGIQDITKQKNDVYIYQFPQKNWKKIHTTTNSVYDCSPTLKRQKKQPRSPDKLTLIKVSPQKSTTQADAMKKILNQNKQKKFQQRKKQLLKQFSQKPQLSTRLRSFSPTTQSMLKTLQAIGNQESTRKESRQEIIYDQTNRKIIGKKPCARDGQTVCGMGDYMYIFGGDRHLMAFNDLYSFDLAKGVKSIQLYSGSRQQLKEQTKANRQQPREQPKQTREQTTGNKPLAREQTTFNNKLATNEQPIGNKSRARLQLKLQ